MRLIVGLMIIAISSTAIADDAQGLALCRVALNRCDDANTQANQVIDDQKAALDFYREDNKRLMDDKNSVLTNPWLWLTVGIITGAIVKGK